jgi:3-hydroxyisobutyrate dehydrogenase
MSTRTYETTSPRRVAFLGLGVMGHPMAGHLARAGHHVTVFNRTASKAAAWVTEYGGKSAATPKAAAAGAEFVFACVGNDDDLRAVTVGADGAFHGMAKGAVFVDHTTASAAIARELHAAANTHGLHFIDAPVSGGQAGAVNGALTVMCGGDAAPFEAMKPVAMNFAKAVTLVGASGAGQLAKMVNQVAIAGLVQGLAEAIAFGQRAGLDMPQAGCDWQRRRTKLANGQPWQDHGARQIRLWFCGGLDAQRPGPGAGRSAPQRRTNAGHRLGGPVLRRGASPGWAAVGHVKFDSAAQTLSD